MLLLLGGVTALLAVYFLQRGVRRAAFLAGERHAVKAGEKTDGVCTGYQWTVNAPWWVWSGTPIPRGASARR
ncbi:hypothetical protein ACFSJS_02740 [Streptomyces desertarenae]|uniref:Uncharacterized protein n=1 Tax=Streptomyces desertarenae TaxID=2666184 RepID=A0ABW4PD27_9ACTN